MKFLVLITVVALAVHEGECGPSSRGQPIGKRQAEAVTLPASVTEAVAVTLPASVTEVPTQDDANEDDDAAKCNLKCHKMMSPVCGDDGKTYDNMCMMACESAFLAFEGSCDDNRRKRSEEGCFCPAIYAPVCGTDDKTYPSKCDMKCVNAEMDYEEGSCDDNRRKRSEEGPGCVCPAIYAPVCGTDGKTYPSKCDIKCENAEMDYEVGSCDDNRRKRSEEGTVEVDPTAVPCGCTENILQRVCGGDGKTYDNMCLLDCADQSLAFEGSCDRRKRSDETPTPCQAIYAPVCGTDGNTYDNMCTLKSQKAEFDYEGECKAAEVDSKPDRRCACNYNLMPVCGGDGKTYSNLCLLNCADQSLAYEGKCDQ